MADCGEIRRQNQAPKRSIFVRAYTKASEIVASRQKLLKNLLKEAAF
jgi:hypothetical protein